VSKARPWEPDWLSAEGPAAKPAQPTFTEWMRAGGDKGHAAPTAPARLMRYPVLLIGPNAEHDLREQLNAGHFTLEQLPDLQEHYERTGRTHLAEVVGEIRLLLREGGYFRDPEWGRFL
jgi:hypothetical protein